MRDKCKDDELMYWWNTVLDCIRNWTQPAPVNWYHVAGEMRDSVSEIIGAEATNSQLVEAEYDLRANYASEQAQHS